MLVCTLGDILAVKRSAVSELPLWRMVCDEGYQLYAYQHNLTTDVLYVGRSHFPLERLHQHVRTYSSNIGDFIKSNYPVSLRWRLLLFTVEECDPIVSEYCPATYQEYRRKIDRPGTYTIGTPLEIAEQALINRYHPPYNSQNRRRIR